uniref:2-amino-3-ketobutyrate coenzyme A ligase, mitochondrial n=1 Tax=Paramoeba aestuarina TaxID=180227 RepID=A0A7S4KNL4_9EUKA|mmetsp:Transcript_22328/g.34684  ORF Transcript_22328/g.34684 Transcript_22328/m.34684 type:complete len:431 (+) Transcript_22328:129-1421(+)|eukprot:CAMPEP_0201541948 /NCGR_PEP_ID=MMETSP0161_2-20130828/71747_1 /ASSEMBLY_ACC=CAM_ASM_000251 /TAXON_ID=180227 /ORGANISM="Neoparamoeba aestuarina, Strain SoJaBio B1-5/56/2" /LENGTH=430 /DNA_ID=CAMNT_0047949529 /DNA_START=55 /DNA_END=1347 /DNA_ORIENTATION=+
MALRYGITGVGSGLFRRSLSSSVSPLNGAAVYERGLGPILSGELEKIRQAGTFKKERTITSPQKSSISVRERDTPVLNFCANNYLGLSDHPALVQASKEVLDSRGFGLSSVRFICGTQDLHVDLEKAISKFHGYPDAILYASAFDANAGLFEAILGEQDAVISDALNHASIIDGIRLCKAKRFRYNHMDLDNLEECLKQAEDARVRMIVTDGVFSMDGHIAPLQEICTLADKYEALVMIDDCHATGFLGAKGRGTAELCGVEERVDVLNTTLGKAMGGATGGYTTGRKEIIDLLRQKSRPYLFSNSLAPAIVGASLKVFESFETGEFDEPLKQLKDNVVCFRSRMNEAGFTVSGSEHPICPVMIYDAKLASDMSDALLERGIYVIGFSYPVVPQGQARIRVQLSAAHSIEEVNQCVDAFIEVGKEFGVIN